MKRAITLVMTVLLISALLVGCDSKSGESSENIKIGLNYELSGNVATYGQSSVKGIEFAIDEINKAGGVLGKQIELVKVDNKSDSAEAANVSTKLATRDKVVVILGPATSGDAKAASPAAMQNKIPLISSSATSDDFTVDSNGKVRDYIFRTCFNDSFQGITMANFAFSDLKAKKAAILIDNTSDYSKGIGKNFKETFEKLGGEILTEEAYQSKDTDYKAVLTNIKGTNPDVLYVPGYYEEVGLIIKQARELGINIPILGADGYDSPKLAEIADKKSLENVYYTNHYSSMDDASDVIKFRESFKKKNGSEPDAFSALGYDMGYFVADAIKRAGEADPEKIKDALADTKDFKGITGTFSMDENHNPVKSITILQLKDGQPSFVKKLEP